MNNNEGKNELENMASMFESMISEPDGMFCESKLSSLYNSPNTSENGINEFTEKTQGVVEVIQNVIEQFELLETQFPNERHSIINLKERYVNCKHYFSTMMNKMQEWKR